MKEIEERYWDARVSELDGISIDYDDWHFNVRPSNTEPLLRLNLESLVSREHMEEKRDEVLDADPSGVTDGIHRIPIPTPFAVGRVNVYLIEDEPLTLVDAGPNSATSFDELTTGLAALGHCARGHRAGDRHPPAHRPPRAGLARGAALGRRGGGDRRGRALRRELLARRRRRTTSSPAR